MAAPEQPDFTFEFLNDTETLTTDEENRLRDEAERRLRKLQGGHSDLIGAAVTVERMEHDETPHLYRARAVAYIRPENIAGVGKRDTAQGALKEALTAVERQVREKRERLRERSR
jgi:ribosome-associated translation inhibitor RaiA